MLSPQNLVRSRPLHFEVPHIVATVVTYERLDRTSILSLFSQILIDTARVCRRSVTSHSNDRSGEKFFLPDQEVDLVCCWSASVRKRHKTIVFKWPCHKFVCCINCGGLPFVEDLFTTERKSPKSFGSKRMTLGIRCI